MNDVVIQSLGPGRGLMVKYVAGISISVSSVVIAWYARKIHQDWEDRAEKVDELYQAFFGMENVSTMEGVVEVVETHEDDIQRHSERIDRLREEMQDVKDKKVQLAEKVDKLKERVHEREGDT